MIRTVERAVGREARLEWLPDQPGDVPITYAEISKARRLLGYNPTTSFAQGIERFVAWHREQHASSGRRADGGGAAGKSESGRFEMARLCAVLLLVLGMAIASGGEKRPAKGPGCTTATVIDWDCDGYGPGSPLGPDADDQDPSVNTSATALAKYGGTEALLEHLGYHPQRTSISPPMATIVTAAPTMKPAPTAPGSASADVEAGRRGRLAGRHLPRSPVLAASGTAAKPMS